MSDKNPVSAFRKIDPTKVIATANQLALRVNERFPESGLGKLANEVEKISQEAVAKTEDFNRPAHWLRIPAFALILVILALLFWMIHGYSSYQSANFSEFMQTLEAGVSATVLIGAAIWFLFNAEIHHKRARAIQALHELRSIAHIVDMHQLVKTPSLLAIPGPATDSSPRRNLDAFHLSRYLEYCIEILAILSKISALYAQSLHDEEVLDAVDDFEDLTGGLSTRITSKLQQISPVSVRN